VPSSARDWSATTAAQRRTAAAWRGAALGAAAERAHAHRAALTLALDFVLCELCINRAPRFWRDSAALRAAAPATAINRTSCDVAWPGATAEENERARAVRRPRASLLFPLCRALLAPNRYYG